MLRSISYPNYYTRPINWLILTATSQIKLIIAINNIVIALGYFVSIVCCYLDLVPKPSTFCATTSQMTISEFKKIIYYI